MSLQIQTSAWFFDGVEWLTIALLTILVPFAIASLQEHFNSKNRRTAFAAMDVQILLDRVFHVFALVGIVISLLFTKWIAQYSPLAAMPFDILLIGSLIGIIVNIYRWTKGDRESFRMAYLTTPSFIWKIIPRLKKNDVINAWQSIWIAEINPFLERRYFELFRGKVSEHLNRKDKKNRDTAAELISNLRYQLDKRTSRFFERGDAYKAAFDWHHNVFRKERENPVESELQWIIEDMISAMISLHINKSDHATLLFYQPEKHAERHEEELDYLENFISLVISTLFSTLDEMDKEIYQARHLHIWRRFPENWRITAKYIQRNPLQRIVWKVFDDWARNRVFDNREIDLVFEDALRYMFREADPITFGRLYQFTWSPYDPEVGQVQSFIESKWTTGVMSRLSSSWARSESDPEERFRQQEREALKLAANLLRFKEEDVRKYIQAANNLESEYPQDSDQESKRLACINTFSKLLPIIDDNSQESPHE